MKILSRTTPLERPPVNRIIRPFQDFTHKEASGGIALLLAAIVLPPLAIRVGIVVAVVILRLFVGSLSLFILDVLSVGLVVGSFVGAPLDERHQNGEQTAQPPCSDPYPVIRNKFGQVNRDSHVGSV